MKKLLLLLSLTTAMTAFGAPQVNPKEEGKMDVTATVISPLTVIASKMEFGKIIQGSSAKASSEYQIKGETGELITVEIPDKVELTSNSGDKMTAKITYKNLPTSIGDNGSSTAAIDGHLDITPDQPVGNYSGVLIARVQYQ